MNILSEIQENIEKVMVGKEQTIQLLLTALAAGGHVLLEDVPGTGKTVLARALAASAGMDFSRIQFTPDLLPSDVTGLDFFNQKEGTFQFRKGPVFTNILLADEINRATPRTQSALLECMAEGQVTVDGTTRALEKPFFVIATQNPVETIGCFPLPEAQMDRFLMKIHMGGLTFSEERAMIDRFIEEEPLEHLQAVASKEKIADLQKQCRHVYVHEDLRDYMAGIVQASRGRQGVVHGVYRQNGDGEPAGGYERSSGGVTKENQEGKQAGKERQRENQAGQATNGGRRSTNTAGEWETAEGAVQESFREGVSPRGTLALVRAAQGYAMLEGSDFVTPEDVKAVAVPVLAHRYLSESLSDEEKEGRIRAILDTVPVPTEDWGR